MASPFSAVPTPFLVEAGAHTYWGRLHLGRAGRAGDAQVGRARWRQLWGCNAAMTLTVCAGAIMETAGAAHFSVPAKQWWDDIVLT